MKYVAFVTLIFLCTLITSAQPAPNVYSATLGETNSKTPEIATEELRHVLADKTALVFDVRPSLEFSISHIPGGINVSQKPGTSKALYISDVAEIGRVLGGDKAKAIVLYCNGPFCGKSKRLSEDLLAAGFTGVKRYQLGMPVWRALGGVSQIELDGARYVSKGDQTAVWLDTRAASEFSKGSLPNAKRIGLEVTKGGKDNPAMQQAKNDGTLPMDDHNTRIIVFGDDLDDVQAIAAAIAKEAFDNVAFFAGKYADLAAAIK
jgi:rhodanese-related sulfurtransferase